MTSKRVWVNGEFAKKLKMMAADKDVSVLKLTKNLNVSLSEDAFKRKRKSVFNQKWVDL